MRMIFEEDIEHSDFLELILTQEEIKELMKRGVSRDYPEGFHSKRNLNVFIRVEKN